MCRLLALPFPRAFLQPPLTVLTRETRRAVRAINQPYLTLDVYVYNTGHRYMFLFSFLVSEQVISSGGVSFSLSFPVPLSPALPRLPSSTAQKSFFGSGSLSSGSSSSRANGAPSTATSAAASWSTQNGVDEDYDA